MKSNLKIYNSLTGEKELFKPLHEDKVGMYVCGPTVYSNVHLGNVRTFLSFDFIFRSLQYLGFKVRYVRNITDAGHLTDDGDVNNDRFVKQSRLEKLEPMEIVQKYTVDFHNVLKLFNLLPPTIEPTATGHIIEQLELTQKLIDKGFAYESNGSVYFDVLEYNNRGLNYGELSRRNIEELFENTRDLDGQNEKKNPQDFALWKKASPQHIMRWSSPWGDGFPGWHLECTAMSTKYLGDQFDIHGGGMDLKFPHHECEIAQGKACNGTSPVKYWMHANMLTMNGQRMSKSTGNYILPMQLITGENDFFEKPFTPGVLRFCFLQAHYRSVLDISNEAMLASEKGFDRLMKAVKQVEDDKETEENFLLTEQELNDWILKCHQALNDDFNSPILISRIFDLITKLHRRRTLFGIKSNNKSFGGFDPKIKTKLLQTLNALVFDVLGLYASENTNNNAKLEEVVNMLINMRNLARANKDFAQSDLIRDQLAAIGIELKDAKDGTTFTL